ncbi:MAG: hypothetical protein ABJA71_15155 [Ginsengibacter sp.]
MVNKLSAFIFMLFFCFACFSQKAILDVSRENKISNPRNDTIYYSINRPLTWDDFKGVPDYSNPGGAVTASGFAFNANMDMTGQDLYLHIRVYTFFSKKNSWKKSNINSSYHLLHEQHHFDITRISAEKFYNELLKANFTINNYNKLLSSLFNKVFDENAALQQEYDSETRHSINTSEQQKWNDRIAQEIKSVTANQYPITGIR